MKLYKLPESLPIESISQVTSLLGTLIGSLRSKEIFLGSQNAWDYNETLTCLREDLAECTEMYDSWLLEDNASEFKAELNRMQMFLAEAEALLKQAATAEAVH